MRLHLPEVLDALDRKPILFATADSVPLTLGPKDKARQRLLAPLLPMMHKAQKFIFDSGSDQDERTVNAVRDTAVNMIDAGLFHLPHAVTWVEDPYTDDPDGKRNFYLCEERPGEVLIHFMQRFSKEDLPPETRSAMPATFIVYANPLRIDLTVAEDPFQVLGARGMSDPMMEKILGEAVYGLKKFIVALNTDDLVTERVRIPMGHKQSLDKRRRLYEHTIVRVPMDVDDSYREGTGRGAPGTKRRKHLVRGHMRFKDRTLEERVWIKPHWRGSQELGVKDRSHYEARR
jgi:hypothetical protein